MEVVLTAYIGFETLCLWQLPNKIANAKPFSDAGSDWSLKDEDACRVYAEMIGNEAKRGNIPTKSQTKKLAKLAKKAEWAKRVLAFRRWVLKCLFGEYQASHKWSLFLATKSPYLIPFVLSLTIFDSYFANQAATLIFLILLVTKTLFFGAFVFLGKRFSKETLGTPPNIYDANTYGLPEESNK